MKFNKVTWHEFKICVRAIFAFGVGYKNGERYRLGSVLESAGKRADAEAWQIGHELATKRGSYTSP